MVEPTPTGERRRSLLTLREVAVRLNVSVDTVRKLVREQQIHVIDVGFGGRRQYRVSEEALSAWLARRTT